MGLVLREYPAPDWTSEAVGCADGPAVVSLMSHVGVLFSQQKIFLLLYVTLYDTL